MVHNIELDRKIPLHQSITEKPNERCPSPIVPAVANFELAKRMHADNLDHQPLPDCVTDLAYRKQQITGAHPGLTLDIEPFATGVGVKAYNVGPTHCTKMKVFRPSTTVSSNPFKIDNNRATSSAKLTKKLGAMDLAIGWDTKPPNFEEELLPPKHIDGSSDSAGPAVFSFVKSPRNNTPASDTGHAACVFNNTLGETGFFERDIMRRKADFGGRNIDQEKLCGCDNDINAFNNESFTVPRARSVTRDFVRENAMMPNRLSGETQSIPNLTSSDLKALREKYLGANDTEETNAISSYQPDLKSRTKRASLQSTMQDDFEVPVYPLATRGGPACRRSNPTFFQRARSRLCHKIAPEPTSCYHGHDIDRHITCAKAPPFRSGMPRYNATGQYIDGRNCCGYGSNHATRVLVVPRPRNPYLKKNYDIDTLIPPFRSLGGGASEGGYPEHWRLASVYQHAYKPLEQRRRPLLDTVYK